ncbi:MAG: hypothetical protein QM831_37800 [Kofleriaceae bacterium]
MANSSTPTVDDVVAARAALTDRQAAVDASDPVELVALLTAQSDTIVAAARTAWAQLAPADRFMLALVIYERLPADQIARVYSIRRESAVERANAARAAFLGKLADDDTRSAIAQATHLSSEII